MGTSRNFSCVCYVFCGTGYEFAHSAWQGRASLPCSHAWVAQCSAPKRREQQCHRVWP